MKVIEFVLLLDDMWLKICEKVLFEIEKSLLFFF